MARSPCPQFFTDWNSLGAEPATLEPWLSFLNLVKLDRALSLIIVGIANEEKLFV